MDYKRWAALAALCAGWATASDPPPAGSLDANTQAARFLATVYGEYDKQRGCWIATTEDQVDYQYCMKLDRVDAITSNTGKRLYILVAGDIVDPNAAGHPSPGLIGAFVLEDHDGRTETIAASKAMAIAGSFGVAPKNWKFVQLGPSDYWGWQNTDDYAYQGLSGGYYLLLAPLGKTVAELGKHRLRAANDDSGMECPEDSKTCGKTSWTATLKADTTTAESVYPLALVVSGTWHGKPLKKTFHIPFERKTWSYQKPDDPIFNEED